MTNKKKLGKSWNIRSLKKWCLVLNTAATVTTAIATLTAATIEALKFLL